MSNQLLFSSELCTDTVCSASECVIPLNDLAEIYNIQNHGRSVRQVVHAMAKNKFCSLRVTDNQCYRLRGDGRACFSALVGKSQGHCNFHFAHFKSAQCSGTTVAGS